MGTSQTSQNCIHVPENSEKKRFRSLNLHIEQRIDRMLVMLIGLLGIDGSLDRTESNLKINLSF